MSKIIKRQLNLVWHRMHYSCTHMATVGVKGLNTASHSASTFFTNRHSITDSYLAKQSIIPLRPK